MAQVPDTNQQADLPQRRFAPVEAGAPIQLDFSGLISDLKQQAAERRPLDLERQAAIGANKQLALDAHSFAQTDPSLDPTYAKAQQDAASHVHLLQTEGDAKVAYAQLEAKNYLNPDGFSKDWQDYTKGVVAPLKDAAPEQAAKVQSQLLAIGVNGQVQAIERQGAFQRQEQQASFQSGLQDLGDTSVQQLEAGGPHAYENMLQSVQQYTQYAQGGTRNADGTPSTLLSPQNAAALTRRAHETFAQAYVTGQTRDAVESGNVGKLKALEAQITGGALFLDPKREAAALANLHGQVRSAQAQARQQNGLIADSAKNDLDSYAEASALNLPVDMDQVKAAARQVNLYANTPKERADGLRKAAAIETIGQLKPLIEQMGPQDVAATQELVGKNATAFGKEAVRVLGGALNARVKQESEATRTGDIAALGPQMDLLTASPGQLGARQRMLAGQRGLAPGLVPLASKSEVAAVASSFKNAEASGDVNAQLGLVQQLQKNFGGSAGGAGVLESLKRDTPQIYLAGAMLTTGNQSAASRLVTLANAGSNINADAIKVGGQAAKMNLAPDDLKILSAVSGGDAAALGGMSDYMQKVFRGGAAEAIAKDPYANPTQAGNLAVTQALNALRPSVAQLSNGVSTVLTRPSDKEKLNEFLSRPENFSGHEKTLPDLVPVPYGSGYVFRDNYNGGVVGRPDGTPVTLGIDRTPATKPEAGAVDPGPAFGNNLGSSSAAQAAIYASQEERRQGLPSGILDSIYRTVQRTSPAERPGVGDWGVSAHKFGGQGPEYAGEKFKDMLNHYSGDQASALAAYASNPKTVDLLRKTYGESWMGHLPPNVGAFVHGVQEMQNGG